MGARPIVGLEAYYEALRAVHQALVDVEVLEEDDGHAFFEAHGCFVPVVDVGLERAPAVGDHEVVVFNSAVAELVEFGVQVALVLEVVFASVSVGCALEFAEVVVVVLLALDVAGEESHGVLDVAFVVYEKFQFSCGERCASPLFIEELLELWIVLSVHVFEEDVGEVHEVPARCFESPLITLVHDAVQVAELSALMRDNAVESFPASGLSTFKAAIERLDGRKLTKVSHGDNLNAAEWQPVLMSFHH